MKERLEPERRGLEGHAKEFGLYLIGSGEPLKALGGGLMWLGLEQGLASHSQRLNPSFFVSL